LVDTFCYKNKNFAFCYFTTPFVKRFESSEKIIKMENKMEAAMNIARLANEAKWYVDQLKDLDQMKVANDWTDILDIINNHPNIKIVGLTDVDKKSLVIVELEEDSIEAQLEEIDDDDIDDWIDLETSDSNDDDEEEDDDDDDYDYNDVDYIDPVEMIDTWEKFRNKFGQDLTAGSQSLALAITEVTNAVKHNQECLQKAIDNMAEAENILSGAGVSSGVAPGPLMEKVNDLKKILKQVVRQAKRLEMMGSVFPVHETFTPEEVAQQEVSPQAPAGPFEESRPFPGF
jgi:hypothetical protein